MERECFVFFLQFGSRNRSIPLFPLAFFFAALSLCFLSFLFFLSLYTFNYSSRFVSVDSWRFYSVYRHLELRERSSL